MEKIPAAYDAVPAEPRDLIDRLGRVPWPETALVVAHPACGTNFLIAETKRRWDEELIHESDRYFEGTLGSVSYICWDFAPWDHVFHLVRHPLHHVISVEGLYASQPQTIQDVARRILGRPISADTRDFLGLALESVLLLNCRAETVIPPERRYRLEDIAREEGSFRPKSHRRRAHSWEPIEATWPEACVALQDMTRRYGYELLE